MIWSVTVEMNDNFLLILTNYMNFTKKKGVFSVPFPLLVGEIKGHMARFSIKTVIFSAMLVQTKTLKLKSLL